MQDGIRRRADGHADEAPSRRVRCGARCPRRRGRRGSPRSPPERLTAEAMFVTRIRRDQECSMNRVIAWWKASLTIKIVTACVVVIVVAVVVLVWRSASTREPEAE